MDQHSATSVELNAVTVLQQAKRNNGGQLLYMVHSVFGLGLLPIRAALTLLLNSTQNTVIGNLYSYPYDHATVRRISGSGLFETLYACPAYFALIILNLLHFNRTLTFWENKEATQH